MKFSSLKRRRNIAHTPSGMTWYPQISLFFFFFWNLCGIFDEVLLVQIKLLVGCVCQNLLYVKQITIFGDITNHQKKYPERIYRTLALVTENEDENFFGGGRHLKDVLRRFKNQDKDSIRTRCTRQ
jgi:hypothetical protein